MKAIVKKEGVKGGLHLMDVPEPTITDTDLLIKIEKTSICGTDVHLYLWDEWAQKTLPIPSIIGHEFVGKVAKVGARVKGFKVGDRVSGEGHITCGQCRFCLTSQRVLCPQTKGIGVNRDGCFAEYLQLPAENAFKVPDEIPDEIASIFDPLGNAVHTALSFDLVGKDVLITGAGPIGIMTIAICKKAGARKVVITDVNDFRLNLAQKFAPTRAVNVGKEDLSSVMKELGIEGFDVSLEMSGSAQAMASLPEYTAHGGHIVILGILPSQVPLDWHKVIFKMLTIKGIYGREIFRTWYQMAHLLQSGLDVSPIITHRFPYHEFEKGFEAMLSGKCGKVVLDWSKAK
jgi:threonine 3-dehydrogenase